MGPASAILLLWAGFMTSHIVLSSATVRPALVSRLGAQGYQGLYSLLALGLFVPLVWIFATHKHAGPLLWWRIGPPGVARPITYGLMTLAFVFFVASLLPGSTPPSAMHVRGPATARGIVRITRHPMLAGFGLFGLAHLFVNGALADVVFFGGFPVFAMLGGRHQDSRKAREVPGYAELARTTSIVPFAAVLTGRQRLSAADVPLPAVALGVVLTVVVRWLHPRLFGP